MSIVQILTKLFLSFFSFFLHCECLQLLPIIGERDPGVAKDSFGRSQYLVQKQPEIQKVSMYFTNTSFRLDHFDGEANFLPISETVQAIDKLSSELNLQGN